MTQSDGRDGAADTVVIGGGVMGWSAAFWLTRLKPGHRVAVLEADPTLERSATGLSVGSIRQQFTTAVNIRMSRFGIALLRDVAGHLGPDAEPRHVDLVENGYLLLAGTAEAAGRLAAAVELQRREGAATELLEAPALSRRFPRLSLDGVVAGAFGPRDEGWFDGPSLRAAFRSAARAAGAQALTDRAAGLSLNAGGVGAVRLASGATLAATHVVCAAGTAAAEVMGWAGVELPVEPRKRTVFHIDAPDACRDGAPLLVDHTGFYLRPEGRGWLTALVPGDADGPADPDDFAPDWEAFEPELWPRLHARAPDFARMKVQGCWAGHYDYNTLDQNALLGADPACPNLYAMAGFSGHGLQQAPAAGRGIAELILTGGWRSLDLSPLALTRLRDGERVVETAVI